MKIHKIFTVECKTLTPITICVQRKVKEEGLLTGSLLDYVNFTELLASTTHVPDEDAPAIAKVQRVLRRVIRETDDCQVFRKYKVR